MSCRLTLSGSIAGLNSLTAFLEFGNDGTINTQHRDLDYEEFSDVDGKPNQRSSPADCTLSDSLIALSPAEDLLVLAKETRAIFLARKYNLKSKDDPNNWSEILWKGSLCKCEGETISSLCCVPLASQQRSSQGAPDWSCVIAGFSSGYVRIYLQTGVLLLSQFLHDGPVISLDLKTKMATKDAHLLDQGEELVILYQNAIVVIDGFSLYQSLKACKNQVAKAHASKNQEAIQPPPLAYRKWRLIGQEHVYDIVNGGMVTPSLFDKLVTNSLTADSRSLVKGSQSGCRKFITSGANPFIGWYELTEENTPPLMSEVALTVASKLTTAVFSSISNATSDWLGIGSKFKSPLKTDASPAKPVVEKGAPMKLRYGLPDKRRRADSIVLSPDSSLAACTDDFGRILIISNDNGLVVRMLKGYRDAQCGWVMIDEHSSDQGNFGDGAQKRQALFLVIFAPRRGILEIWLAEQGNRVGAFNVGKDCRLIYNGYGTLGSRVTAVDSDIGLFNSCILLESNGTLSAINVPFHCSLSSLHSLRARDSYLLRKISNFLEKTATFDHNDEQLMTLKIAFQEIEAPDTFYKGIQRIILSGKLTSESMEKCICSVEEILSSRVEQIGPNGDIEYLAEMGGILRFCEIQIDLIKLYKSLKELHAGGKDIQSDAINNKQEIEDLADSIKLSETEKANFMEIMKNLEGFDTNDDKAWKELRISDFLLLFCNGLEGNIDQSDIPRLPLVEHLKLSDDEKSMKNLGSLFFKPFIDQQVSITNLDLLLNSPYIELETCMCLLVIYCQYADISRVGSLNAIHQIIRHIFEVETNGKEDEAKSLLSWWTPERNILEKASSPGKSLVLAYLFRGVTMSTLTSNNADMEEIERVAPHWIETELDKDKWTKLIEKLVDLLLLERFLHIGHFDELTTGKTLPLTLSIKGVLEGGKGAITQIVAAHIVRCRIPGPCVASSDSLKRSDSSLETDDGNSDDENSEILKAFRELQERFPYSLEMDAVLAHCCWECIILWKKDVEETPMLSSAVIHLSCISNVILKQGLAILFWKAVFKDSIKNTYSLIEKIGKSPKDRLCRKHIGMSITALEKYLLTAYSLLRQLLQEEDSSTIEFPEFQVEPKWITTARNSVSIIESAMDEPTCEVPLLKNMWNLTVVLRFIVLTGMKAVRTSELFHPEEIRASTHLFPATAKLPEHDDPSCKGARAKFCSSSLTLAIDEFLARTVNENHIETLTTTANDIFELCNNFGIDEDALWQTYTCQLFNAGLDNIGYEAMLSVHNKEELVTPLLETAGSRLSGLLIETTESEILSTVISSMPTHITSWLQNRQAAKPNARKTTIKENVELLNRIFLLCPAQNDTSKFIKDIIDSLEIFSVT